MFSALPSMDGEVYNLSHIFNFFFLLSIQLSTDSALRSEIIPLCSRSSIHPLSEEFQKAFYEVDCL